MYEEDTGSGGGFMAYLYHIINIETRQVKPHLTSPMNLAIFIFHINSVADLIGSHKQQRCPTSTHTSYKTSTACNLITIKDIKYYHTRNMIFILLNTLLLPLDAWVFGPTWPCPHSSQWQFPQIPQRLVPAPCWSLQNSILIKSRIIGMYRWVNICIQSIWLVSIDLVLVGIIHSGIVTLITKLKDCLIQCTSSRPNDTQDDEWLYIYPKKYIYQYSYTGKWGYQIRIHLWLVTCIGT